MVYLDCDPAASLERIKTRGRASESGVPLEYLQNLERHYSTEMMLHMRESTANIVPVQWDVFGSVMQVLDCMLKGTQYAVVGDPQLLFARDRQFRAKAVATLALEGRVDISAMA